MGSSQSVKASSGSRTLRYKAIATSRSSSSSSRKRRPSGLPDQSAFKTSTSRVTDQARLVNRRVRSTDRREVSAWQLGKRRLPGAYLERPARR
jgi:hypothetical protein